MDKQKITGRVSRIGAAALASGLLALAVSATPASAQFFYRSWGAPIYAPSPFYSRPVGLRAGDVHRMLVEEGYDVVGVYRNGRVFVADVFGRRGRDRLIVDAYNGRVVQAYGNGRAPSAYGDDPAYAPRRTARIVPPADIERSVIPGITQPSAPAQIKPRATAPARIKPREQAAVPPASRAAPRSTIITPAKPALAAKPAPAANTPVPKPSTPPSEAVRATPAPAPEPVRQTAAPRVNDVPVAPLDDAMPKVIARPPVNDIPVAPLE